MLGKIDAGATTLSRGMRQKLAVCCAYLYNPTVVPLDEPLTGIEPVPLIDDVEFAAPGVRATILGWGSTDALASVFPDLLQEAEIPIVENAVGNVPAIYNGTLTDRMLIAGFQAGGVDTCFADSGGPLLVPDPDGGAFYLAGITSFGGREVLGRRRSTKA